MFSHLIIYLENVYIDISSEDYMFLQIREAISYEADTREREKPFILSFTPLCLSVFEHFLDLRKKVL